MSPPPDADARIERMEQAALWLQRLNDDQADDSLLEAWLDWCQRDPQNQQAFDGLAVIWEATAELGDELNRGPVMTPAATPDPEFAALAEPANDGMPVRGRRFALAASLAGMGLAAVLGGAWWMNGPAAGTVHTAHLTSRVGTNSTHHLSDGSLLELGAGSRASVRIDSRERRIELHEGELFVVVDKDPQRPFSVDAGKLKVIATGTEFNVLRTTERTIVTVAEGSVDAKYDGQNTAAPNVSLQSSQQLVYAHATGRVTVRETDPLEAIAWRSGSLHFRNEPLSEVVAKVNRYSGRPILIDHQSVGDLPFTGTARADRIQGWLQGLPHIFPVAIEALPDGRHRIVPVTATD